MTNRFHFPVVNPNAAGSRVSRTYASVANSILGLIKALGGSLAGIDVCPAQGYFDLILHPYPGDPNNGRRVRLRFNFPNLYLQAFKTHGVRYVFRHEHPIIVPSGVPAHRYVVLPLPFEGGYTNGGLEADFTILTFGRSVSFDIYVCLRDFPNKDGGIKALKKNLARVCVLFPEAMRFPIVGRFLVWRLKSIERVTVHQHRWMFNVWEQICRAIRDGPDHFTPIQGTNLDTYEKLIPIV